MPYANPNEPTPPGGYSNYFLNNTPEAGFWYYLTSRGLLGNDPRARYAQGQYGRTYGMYSANAADNPNEGFFDYLNRTQPNFEQDFMNQSPEMRGDYTSRTLTPKARFIKAY